MGSSCSNPKAPLPSRSSCTILFPLYIYPSQDAWSPLIRSIQQYPHCTFITIVNPNSGPGNSPLPDTSYLTALPLIAQDQSIIYPNSVVLGYVHTQWGKRPVQDVLDEIDTYAQWTQEYRKCPEHQDSHTNRDILIDGIFFDEVATELDLFKYYRRISDAVRSKEGFRTISRGERKTPWVVLNPGTQPNPAYYEIADVVVAKEDSMADYRPMIRPSGVKPSSVAVVGYGLPRERLGKTVQQLVESEKVGNLFLTDVDTPENVYGRFPAYWDEFVRTVCSSNCSE